MKKEENGEKKTAKTEKSARKSNKNIDGNKKITNSKKVFADKKRYVSKAKKYKDVDVFNEDIEKTEDDRSIIDVVVKSEKDVYNPYGTVGKDLMNDTLYNYIKLSSKKISVDKDIAIRLNTPPMNNAEKKRVTNCFKDNFLYDMKKSKQKLMINTISNVVLLIMGILMLGLSFLFYGLKLDEFLISLVNIFGTFFIWKGCEGLLERKTLRYDYLRTINLYEAEIIFD